MNAQTQELAPRTAPTPIVADPAAGLLQVIARAAADPACDVDKMQRLLDMQRSMLAQQAEVAFNAAMADVQTRMGRVGTDRHNNQTHSDYATYAKLDRALRPLYTAAGFALSFGTEDAPTDLTVRVVCHVTHRDGHTRRYFIDMPADGKGAKGNDVMTRTHATGSATQYGMRYLLKMIFNVAIGGEDADDDGNAADATLGDWPDAIAACIDHDGLKKVKAEMVATFGGAMNIPKALVRTYNAKWEAVK